MSLERTSEVLISLEEKMISIGISTFGKIEKQGSDFCETNEKKEYICIYTHI